VTITTTTTIGVIGILDQVIYQSMVGSSDSIVDTLMSSVVDVAGVECSDCLSQSQPGFGQQVETIGFIRFMSVTVVVVTGSKIGSSRGS